MFNNKPGIVAHVLNPALQRHVTLQSKFLDTEGFTEKACLKKIWLR